MAANDIAIVGVGCRFPGADNVDEFWRVLLNGEDHVKEIPISRWNNDAFYDEDQTVHGKTYVRKAGLLNNYDCWDNRLFGISDVEARQIDPQQRYVLECVHMALEDGGITRKQLSGSNTGVIIGCMNNDYKAISNSSKADIGSYNATSTSASVIAARVSYVYNLQGTCLTLDTACSSALVAIHLAKQAIQTGDCDMMICGGVSSILTPDTFVALCKARMLSATGKCQSFCETADGYARGEGCGIVILKSLKSALEDNNKVWATIKTGSNQDGSTARPMTAPSADQQLQLLREVYDRHKFDTADIQYIEAHGTGTPRGDPTELDALGQFFFPSRQATAPLLIGSVKSNIGHTESAAGVAGLIKILLMMKHGKYVPSLHVKHDNSNINKKIKLTQQGLDIATSLDDWKLNSNGTRHACLNSFGFGGSNIHAIISHMETEIRKTNREEENNLKMICISGFSKESLKLNLHQFKNDLDDFDGSIRDIAITSRTKRDIFTYRILLCGTEVAELQREIEERVTMVDQLVSYKTHNIVFVYYGECSTWTGMGRSLMKENDIFINKIKEVDEYLEPLTGWKVGPKLLNCANQDNSGLNIIATFSIQIALTDMWKLVGIKPVKIVGQSIGEVASGYAANILTLKEAVNIIYLISKSLSIQKETLMVVIGNINITEVENICARYGNKVYIAFYNSQYSCTLSGDEETIRTVIEILKATLNKNKIFIHELRNNCAYHSSLLKEEAKIIRTAIDHLFAYQSTNNLETKDIIPMISTVNTTKVKCRDLRSGTYWSENIIKPVMFQQSIKIAIEDEPNYNIFLAVGPQPSFQSLPSNIPGLSDKTRFIPTCAKYNDTYSMKEVLKELFELGIDIDFNRLLSCQVGDVTNIPRCIFNRTCPLTIPNSTREYLSGIWTAYDKNHMFVQSYNQRDFRLCIDPSSTPFVYDHFLSNKTIIPGATYVETGFYIGTQLMQTQAQHLAVGFKFIRTFSPKKDKQNILNINIDKKDAKCIEFSVLNDDVTLASGKVFIEQRTANQKYDIDFLFDLCPFPKSKVDCYSTLEKLNFKYGERLSLIEEAWLNETGEKCLAKLIFPERFFEAGATKTHFHPAVIDAVFQIFGIIEKESILEGENFVIPMGVESVKLWGHIETVMYVYAEKVAETNASTSHNSVLMTRSGDVIAEIGNFYTRIISNNEFTIDESSFYKVEWIETLNLMDADNFQTKKILLFSNCPESNWICELKEYCEIHQIFDTEQLSLYFEENELKDSTSLIYHVGKIRENVIFDESNDILDESVERLLQLRSIINLLNESRTKIQFAVITENTQLCPERSTYNFIGSEIWGFMRSAYHESILYNTSLIDIDQNRFCPVSFINLLSLKQFDDIEFALSASKIFISKLVIKQRTKATKRPLSEISSKEFAILSTNSDKIKDPFLMLNSKIVCSANSEQIYPETFTIHDQELYPLISSEKSCLGQSNGQIIVLEGTGKNDSNDCVSFLFPLYAKSSVQIPKECLIATKEINVGINGLLIFMNIAVQLSITVPQYSKVVVLRNLEKGDFGQQIFTDIMKSRHCSVYYLTFEDLRKQSLPISADTLIVTTHFTFQVWKMIKIHFPGTKRITSLNIFTTQSFSGYMHIHYPQIDVTTLNTMEIFETEKIKNIMPLIRKHLSNIPCIPIETASTFLVSLPLKSLDLKEAIKNDSLRFFCCEKSLFRTDSCYILTGGSSGLGWELLNLIVKRGAGLVVNFSRRKPPSFIKEIEVLAKTYSCKILSVQVDVSDFDSVKDAFQEVHDTFPSYPI